MIHGSVGMISIKVVSIKTIVQIVVTLSEHTFFRAVCSSRTFYCQKIELYGIISCANLAHALPQKTTHVLDKQVERELNRMQHNN